MKNKDDQLSFEDAFDQLQQIVEKLENSETDLEESLEIFEKGIQLINYCNNKLEEAEGKFKKLMKNGDGNFKLEDIKE